MIDSLDGNAFGLILKKKVGSLSIFTFIFLAIFLTTNIIDSNVTLINTHVTQYKFKKGTFSFHVIIQNSLLKPQNMNTI